MTVPVLCALLMAAGAAPPPAEGELPVAVLARQVGPSIVRLGVFSDGQQQGNGTGFFVRQDGIVVTNHHVVAAVEGDFVAVLADGSKRRVLGALADDEAHDIAIVKIEGAGYPTLPLAGAGAIAVGAPAYLVGSSRGLDQSLGVGVVSAVRDSYPEDWLEQARQTGEKMPKGPIVQHTATSAPGSSGSPVLNGKGEVIAVHHSQVPGSPIYFGAHVDLLRELLSRTDLDAKPVPLGPNKQRNLVVSLVFYGAIAAAGLTLWVVRRRRARRSGLAIE